MAGDTLGGGAPHGGADGAPEAEAGGDPEAPPGADAGQDAEPPAPAARVSEPEPQPEPQPEPEPERRPEAEPDREPQPDPTVDMRTPVAPPADPTVEVHRPDPTIETDEPQPAPEAPRTPEPTPQPRRAAEPEVDRAHPDAEATVVDLTAGEAVAAARRPAEDDTPPPLPSTSPPVPPPVSPAAPPIAPVTRTVAPAVPAPATPPAGTQVPAPQAGEQFAGDVVPPGDDEDGWERARRRHRRQTLTFTGGFACVLVVGLLAYLTFLGHIAWPFGGKVDTSASVCTRSKPLQPKTVTLRVYNGSTRKGLAVAVTKQLQAFGFVVEDTGNDPLEAKLSTPIEVRRGATGDLAARTTEAYLNGKVRDVVDDRQSDSVDVVLGPGFSRVKTRKEAAAALAALTDTLPLTCPVGVSPSGSPSPGGSPTPSRAPHASGSPSARPSASSSKR